MRFATDTGGTFTDLIIEDEAGHIQMFKAATVPSEPVKGVLDAFEIAAKQFQIDRRTLLGRGDMFIHGTTHAINAIVTKKTAKTALAGHQRPSRHFGAARRRAPRAVQSCGALSRSLHPARAHI